ncbi:putative NADH-ubiquinone oxidoreductase 16 kDa subunit [Cocos nucifera]|nr:putative NADH-ubiquinone oxidoreductase 16 kDa subunit [Cocos nucifera]
MAMRSALGGIPRLSQSAAIAGGAGWRSARPFSEGKGKVLSEEERAKENVYIQKMEREKLEKMKHQVEKEKLELEREKAEKLIPSYECLLDVGVVLCSSIIPSDNEKPPHFKSIFLRSHVSLY